MGPTRQVHRRGAQPPDRPPPGHRHGRRSRRAPGPLTHPGPQGHPPSRPLAGTRARRPRSRPAGCPAAAGGRLPVAGCGPPAAGCGQRAAGSGQPCRLAVLRPAASVRRPLWS
ncbi:hypothetical protein EAD89_11105 [Micromonospora sp. BL4]|nr:hypothetical protein EAD89_11105 [Micromonospora sp. BL4]